MENFNGTKNVEIHYDSDFVMLKTSDEKDIYDYDEVGRETAIANAKLNQLSYPMLKLLDSINERLANLLNDEDLTSEKLRDASESLLPNIQSECSKLILSIND